MKNNKTISTPTYRTSGNLPHWEIPGKSYFITFCTHQRQKLPDLAKRIVLNSILFWDNRRWIVHQVIVLSDHVHLVVTPLPYDSVSYWSISFILQSVKGFSSWSIKKELSTLKVKTLWQKESYDRLVITTVEDRHAKNYLIDNALRDIEGLKDLRDHPFYYEESAMTARRVF